MGRDKAASRQWLVWTLCRIRCRRDAYGATSAWGVKSDAPRHGGTKAVAHTLLRYGGIKAVAHTLA